MKRLPPGADHLGTLRKPENGEKTVLCVNCHSAYALTSRMREVLGLSKDFATGASVKSKRTIFLYDGPRCPGCIRDDDDTAAESDASYSGFRELLKQTVMQGQPLRIPTVAEAGVKMSPEQARQLVSYTSELLLEHMIPIARELMN